MTADRLSMPQVKEILRQNLALGRSHQLVARSIGISARSVGSVVRRAKAAGLDWTQTDAVDEPVWGPTLADHSGATVDFEWLNQESKLLGRALKEARLELSKAHVDDVDVQQRELDKRVVRPLSASHWVQAHQAVLITGRAGTGKTYVACALAQHARRKGFRAVYRRASRLLNDLRVAHGDGSYARMLTRLAQVDILIIDGFADAPVRREDYRYLLEILEDRYGTRSTIVTSQLAPTDWRDYLDDPTLTDALCDRFVHHAHQLALGDFREEVVSVRLD
jgi:DNA replication protein DnaC